MSGMKKFSELIREKRFEELTFEKFLNEQKTENNIEKLWEEYENLKFDHGELFNKFLGYNEYQRYIYGYLIENLSKFKNDIEESKRFEELKKQVNDILSSFSFEDEEVQELKDKALNREIDLEKFEDKLCVLEVKKLRSQKFSVKQVEENSLPISDTEKVEEVGKYQNILNKYGNKK